MTDAKIICHDLDLLGDWLDAKGYTEEAGLCLRVLGLIREQQDEIEKLRAVLISDKLETVNALHGETLEKLDDNT